MDETKRTFRVFTINTGSTSTKVALFDGDEKVFEQNIAHDASDLARFDTILAQKDYRRSSIMDALTKAGVTLEGVDAFSGRSGGIQSIETGCYGVNDKMLEDISSGEFVQHPANLSAVLALDFAKEHGGIALVVSDPTTDEFQEVARLTGLKGVYRHCYAHAMNQKEVGRRWAAEHGRRYEDLNLVICHIGGGVSVTAHRRGRIVDTNDIASGDGPMAPTRSGSMPAKDIVDMCFSGEFTEDQMDKMILKDGGFVSHLGTSDVLEVKRMVADGDEYARVVYEAFCYQIGKQIGCEAAALHGEVDAILVTGGIAHDQDLVDYLRDMCGWIAPFGVYAGDFEQEALAHGAQRVLSGEERLRTYDGEAVWKARW
jgi:butyrate kinase